jgi:hypothetical protein
MKAIVLSEKQKESLAIQREALMSELAEIGPFIAATLVTSYRICGTKTCSCMKENGVKHKTLTLTWKENKKTKSVYVPKVLHDEVVLWGENYKKIKSILAKLSDLQLDLIRIRD